MTVNCPKCKQETLEVITTSQEEEDNKAKLFISKAKCKNCNYQK